MLSYRHAFHAGNHADIFKHSVLSLIVRYITKKPKPFSYIDSHAGAGIYNLESNESRKTGEAANGIEHILSLSDIPELLLPYVEICKSLHETNRTYPGSPEIVRTLSRNEDQLTLMELHSAEIENLKDNMGGDPRIHIHHRDGYAGLNALCPPEPKRGFALIDPSYETVSDYSKTAETIIKINKKWPVGTIILWYPIVPRRISELSALKDRLYTSAIPNILCTELMVHPLPETIDEDSEWGLAGSGLLILNPPWKLAEELQEILPWLAQTLGEEVKGSWSVEWLSEPS